MFHRKQRRFRNRSNGRKHQGHIGGNAPMRMRSNTFINGQPRNNFRQTLSPEKMFEKYNSLAKEAMTSGDKTSSENYFQHADHFMRVIEDKNRNRNQNKDDLVSKPKEEEKLPEVSNIDQESQTRDKK